MEGLTEEEIERARNIYIQEVIEDRRFLNGTVYLEKYFGKELRVRYEPYPNPIWIPGPTLKTEKHCFVCSRVIIALNEYIDKTPEDKNIFKGVEKIVFDNNEGARGCDVEWKNGFEKFEEKVKQLYGAEVID